MLGRVWELADIDKDGMLDSDEFAVVRKGAYVIIVLVRLGHYTKQHNTLLKTESYKLDIYLPANS